MVCHDFPDQLSSADYENREIDLQLVGMQVERVLGRYLREAGLSFHDMFGMMYDMQSQVALDLRVVLRQEKEE